MFNILPPQSLARMATLKNVLLLFALFLSFTAGIMPMMEADIKSFSGGVGVLDLQFFYTPAHAQGMLNAYGPEGIRLYLAAQWTADLIFPAIAGVFLMNLLIWSGARRWFWLGAVVTVLDWTENIFITLLLVQYPVFHPELAWLSCIFTLGKWLFLITCMIITLIHLLRKLVLRYSNKRVLRA